MRRTTFGAWFRFSSRRLTFKKPSAGVAMVTLCSHGNIVCRYDDFSNMDNNTTSGSLCFHRRLVHQRSRCPYSKPGNGGPSAAVSTKHSKSTVFAFASISVPGRLSETSSTFAVFSFYCFILLKT